MLYIKKDITCSQLFCIHFWLNSISTIIALRVSSGLDVYFTDRIHDTVTENHMIYEVSFKNWFFSFSNSILGKWDTLIYLSSTQRKIQKKTLRPPKFPAVLIMSTVPKMISHLQMHQYDKASKSFLFATCPFFVESLLPQSMICKSDLQLVLLVRHFVDSTIASWCSLKARSLIL